MPPIPAIPAAMPEARVERRGNGHDRRVDCWRLAAPEGSTPRTPASARFPPWPVPCRRRVAPACAARLIPLPHMACAGRRPARGRRTRRPASGVARSCRSPCAGRGRRPSRSSRRACVPSPRPGASRPGTCRCSARASSGRASPHLRDGERFASRMPRSARGHTGRPWRSRRGKAPRAACFPSGSRPIAAMHVSATFGVSRNEARSPPPHLRRLLALAPAAAGELMLHQPVEALLHVLAERLGLDGRRPDLRARVGPRLGPAPAAFSFPPGGSSTRARPARETPQATRHDRDTTNARNCRRCLMEMPPRDVLGDSVRPRSLRRFRRPRGSSRVHPHEKIGPATGVGSDREASEPGLPHRRRSCGFLSRISAIVSRCYLGPTRGDRLHPRRPAHPGGLRADR